MENNYILLTAFERIELLRNNLGYKKIQICEAIGISLNAYNLWGAGGNIKSKNLIALSNFLKVSCDFLLGLSNDISRENSIYPPEKQKLINMLKSQLLTAKQCENLMKAIMNIQYFSKRDNNNENK